MPALAISLLALGLSVFVFFYTRNKDLRARQQSIQDDFWLRKIVSPVSIEPFVKFAGELIAKLPGEQTSQGDLDEFGRTNLAELRSLTVAFGALQLLSEDLYNKVEAGLEAIEDRLATYLAALQQFGQGQVPLPPSRPEAIAELSALRLRVLEPVKQHQSVLGHD